jgi:predicted ABC-type exoprotein transport system permease subunit
VLTLPWAVFAALLLLMVPMFMRFSPSEEFFTLLWAGVCLANNLIWFRWARGGLNRSFRNLATTRFDPAKAGWFAKMFSR